MIRKATPEDAGALVELIALLEHRVSIEGVQSRLANMHAQLVAVENDRIVGLCGLNVMSAIHREQPVGRITILVVAEDARGKGIGTELVGAAEQMFRQLGCKLIEVTSNDRLTEAHEFYRNLGYEVTSRRFARTLD